MKKGIVEIKEKGDFAATERQKRVEKLEDIKKQIEAVRNWTRECKCQYCTTEFVININGIARIYPAYVEDGIGFYGCACPVCGREVRFSQDVLPMIGTRGYDYKHHYTYDISPGYKALSEILSNNKVEYCDGVENGYPVRRNRGIFRKRYYIKNR